MQSPHPIVITGIGTWTCFGRGLQPLANAVRSGAVGFAPVDKFDTTDPWFPTRNGMQVRLPGSPDPVRDVAMAVASKALNTAGLTRGATEVAPGRGGVFTGSSHGANHLLLSYLEQLATDIQPDGRLLSRGSAWVARELGMRHGLLGPNITVNTACSSSLNAMGQAMVSLQTGRIDVALAGGADAFSLLSFAGFSSLGALDPQGCRPFDRTRAGLSLGDGTAYFVLERQSDAEARGARILATLTGFASCSEGYHPTRPDPDGNVAEQAMRRALAADACPEELDLVSAHGTGTPANDGAELNAIGRVVGSLERTSPTAVVSVKSQCGHTLGSAGAIQIAALLGAWGAGVVPCTPTLEHPIPHPDHLVLPTKPSAGSTRLALVNSFGFGGSLASMAIRFPPTPGVTT